HAGLPAVAEVVVVAHRADGSRLVGAEHIGEHGGALVDERLHTGVRGAGAAVVAAGRGRSGLRPEVSTVDVAAPGAAGWVALLGKLGLPLGAAIAALRAGHEAAVRCHRLPTVARGRIARRAD